MPKNNLSGADSGFPVWVLTIIYYHYFKTKKNQKPKKNPKSKKKLVCKNQCIGCANSPINIRKQATLGITFVRNQTINRFSVTLSGVSLSGTLKSRMTIAFYK